MEHEKGYTSPQPGLAEALHPEIGNGVLWTSPGHQHTLRHPDPSKAIEKMLDESIPKSPDNHPDTISPLDPEIEHGRIAQQSDAEVKEGDEEKKDLTRVPLHKKSTSKKKVAKKGENAGEIGGASDAIEIEKNEEGIEDQKAPKAGKRLRKAAKALKKKETEIFHPIPERPVTIKNDPLSPFTRWLKNLRGSEYVHPYDDDFAIRQDSLGGGQGMSETYADLLAAQGHKEQAIRMYQQLMEKYPEKSSFFAAKIENLL